LRVQGSLKALPGLLPRSHAPDPPTRYFPEPPPTAAAPIRAPLPFISALCDHFPPCFARPAPSRELRTRLRACTQPGCPPHAHRLHAHVSRRYFQAPAHTPQPLPLARGYQSAASSGTRRFAALVALPPPRACCQPAAGLLPGLSPAYCRPSAGTVSGLLW